MLARRAYRESRCGNPSLLLRTGLNVAAGLIQEWPKKLKGSFAGPLFLESYVVYLGGHSYGAQATSYDLERATDSHYELLGSLLGSKEKAKDAIFYSYTRFINGFAANLEEEDAMGIAKYSRVVSVFPNKGRELHTTHSWSFLGLERDDRVPKKSIWSKARLMGDVIIGNLDSGVWPESKSFSDEGFGPIPSKWKGTCQNSTLDRIHCNRKLIGVRFFKEGYEAEGRPLNISLSTARDFEGHGTHTLSTAGGRIVSKASVLGHGKGKAKGGAPNSRVAAYKVCWPSIDGKTCFDSDIIAAFDAAIHDGVDIISVSLGGVTENYFEDGISVGAFHAVKNGIMVVCSAGNMGSAVSVLNTAPWIFTVGASTMDRKFYSFVVLGNKKRFKGESLSNSSLPVKMSYPLISSKDAQSAGVTEEDVQFCPVGSLDPEKVKGKIVFCLVGGGVERVEKGKAVLDAGGIGMILANNANMRDELLSEAHILPAAHISATDGRSILDYIKSTKSPTAYITYPKTNMGTRPAPMIASFSSQGPNPLVDEILKPDIVAPGVNIIAAFSEARSPSKLSSDTRRVLFNAMSGTSMSCPHISGIAALLKALHPDWSPAAIRSAMMTTARTQDNMHAPIRSSTFENANPFSYGSGLVQPNRAMNPGLVYDLKVDEYLNFLCTLRYRQHELANFNKSYNCPKSSPDLINFNYPSITIPSLSGLVNVTRTLKNVGTPGTYRVRVHEPKGVSVSVEPSSLQFEKVGDERMFSLIVKSMDAKGGSDYVFGKLTWSDGIHFVRSPLVVRTTEK